MCVGYWWESHKERATRKTTTMRVYNNKMDLRETGWNGMDWIAVAQDRDQWKDLVNMILNLGAP
jgi:hypothetical protein